MEFTADITGRATDLGDLVVRRLLPASAKRTVGPFIFLDHFGPVQMPPGHGMDVRPHPHIGLATVTYLFEGEIIHRDSLGNVQPIRPGAVNLMTAGRGIVHSERSGPEARQNGAALHGLQAWLALPKAFEETAAAFVHHPAESLPVHRQSGVTARIVLGSAYGLTSPVAALAGPLFIEIDLAPGARIALEDIQGERALYPIHSDIRANGRAGEANHLLLLPPGPCVIEAPQGGRVMVLGGDALEEPPHLWWNFVSRRRERIEEAKQDWAMQRFEPVAGETEFIPLPAH